MPVFVTEFLWHFLFIFLHTVALIPLFAIIFFVSLYLLCPVIYPLSYISNIFIACSSIYFFSLYDFYFIYLALFVNSFQTLCVYFPFLFLIL